MARRVHSDGTVLVWGETGAAVVIPRLAPGVVYVIGVRNFDGPFDDGPMRDFDREIEAHGSIHLFMDVRNVERGARKSRQTWKDWASRNRANFRSYMLVHSSLLHMAISVIAMASGTATHSYNDEAAFLAELKRKVQGISALPEIPTWASAILENQIASR